MIEASSRSVRAATAASISGDVAGLTKARADIRELSSPLESDASASAALHHSKLDDDGPTLRSMADMEAEARWYEACMRDCV
jgi:hypothetical protein